MLLGDFLLIVMYACAFCFVLGDYHFLDRRIKKYMHKKFGAERSFWLVIFPIILMISILATILNYKGIEL